jgi:hypothetical protein
MSMGDGKNLVITPLSIQAILHWLTSWYTMTWKLGSHSPKKFFTFEEHNNSFLSSQNPTLGPYCEEFQTSPQLLTLFLRSILILVNQWRIAGWGWEHCCLFTTAIEDYWGKAKWEQVVSWETCNHNFYITVHVKILVQVAVKQDWILVPSRSYVQTLYSSFMYSHHHQLYCYSKDWIPHMLDIFSALYPQDQ